MGSAVSRCARCGELLVVPRKLSASGAGMRRALPGPGVGGKGFGGKPRGAVDFLRVAEWIDGRKGVAGLRVGGLKPGPSRSRGRRRGKRVREFHVIRDYPRIGAKMVPQALAAARRPVAGSSSDGWAYVSRADRIGE